MEIWSFPAVHYFTYKLEFVSDILEGIVDIIGYQVIGVGY